MQHFGKIKNYGIIQAMRKELIDKKLPSFFKPILWSYDFSSVTSEKYKKTIILNAINYGDLKHWRWISRHYGKNAVKETLEQIPATAIRTRARKLSSVVFSIKNLNYASRGSKQ